jgi:hypothetical protein
MFWMPEDTLTDGLRRFQSEQGLRPDGLIMPGGPTETAINTALSGRERNGNVRDAPGSRGTEHAFEVADFGYNAEELPFATEPPQDEESEEARRLALKSREGTSSALTDEKRNNGDYELFQREIRQLATHKLHAWTPYEKTGECVALVKHFRADLGPASGWKKVDPIGLGGIFIQGMHSRMGLIKMGFTEMQGLGIMQY